MTFGEIGRGGPCDANCGVLNVMKSCMAVLLSSDNLKSYFEGHVVSRTTFFGMASVQACR